MRQVWRGGYRGLLAARAPGISRETFYPLLNRNGKDVLAGDAEGSESDV